MTQESFEAEYAQMTNEELARILRDRRDLVPEARVALNREISNRHIDPEALHKLRPRSIDKPRHKTEVEKRLGHLRIRGAWLLALMAISFLFAAILDHFGVLQLFWPIILTIAASVFTIWGHWELKEQPWFWIIVAVITMAHTVLFYFMGWPWGTRWVPASAINGLFGLDLVGIFAFISVIEKRMIRINHFH